MINLMAQSSHRSSLKVAIRPRIRASANTIRNCCGVTYAQGCTDYIKTKKVALLTQEQVTRICTDISRGALRQSFATDRKHVQHVKEIVRVKSMR